MMKKRNLLMFPLGGALLFAACGQITEQEQKSGYRIKGDTVYVADHVLNEKIRVSEARLEPYSKEVITSGIVRPIPTRYAYIAPPFAGRVLKSYIQIGQTVSHRALRYLKSVFSGFYDRAERVLSGSFIKGTCQEGFEA